MGGTIVEDYSYLYGSLTTSDAPLGSSSKQRRTVDMVKHTIQKSARKGDPYFCPAKKQQKLK